MKRLVLSLLILLPFLTEAQPADNFRKGDSKQKLMNNDSLLQKIQKIKDSVVAATDSQQVSINLTNNAEKLQEIQKENNDRKRRTAVTRLAIGAALLALLIMGLMKRRKKQG